MSIFETSDHFENSKTIAAKDQSPADIPFLVLSKGKYAKMEAVIQENCETAIKRVHTSTEATFYSTKVVLPV